MEQRYAIPGYPRNTLVRRDGEWVVLGVSGRPLTLIRHTRDGRPQFMLNTGEGRGRDRAVQLGRIVLLAMAGEPEPPRDQCCHADGNPWNNDPRNLRWGTVAENNREKVDHGTSNAGERSWTAKLTWEKVRRIRAEHVPNAWRGHGDPPTGSTLELARRYSVSRETIRSIVGGRTWQDRPQR